MTQMNPPHSSTVKNASQVKTYGCFAPLPAGSIKPGGWLRAYAHINASSWLLHYARSQDVGVYGKFWQRNQTAAVVFDEFNQTLTLCDYTAYFADGLVHYAQLFPDSDLAVEARSWLERLLASQDVGYLGAFEPHARWQHWLEIFSQALTQEALLFWYEFSDDDRFLSAAAAAARPQMQAWYHPEQALPPAEYLASGSHEHCSNDQEHPAAQVQPGIFSGHGTIIVRALGRLYALTGDLTYLRFATDVLDRYGMTRTFLQPGDGVFGLHNAVGSEHVGLPAMLYEYNGVPELLQASQAAWEMLEQKHLSVDGTPHGNETMQFTGPLHNCEHCSTVEWFITSNVLARLTSEIKYADAAEKAFYNAYPAAKSPDGMLVAYMHTPNQLVASEWSQPHGWTSPDWCASRQHYHSAHEPLCCNVNGSRGIPYFIKSMVVRTSDGLAILYYGQCQAEATLPHAGRVSVQMDTGYPFEDQVMITIGTSSDSPGQPVAFSLRLRIPGWCRAANLTLNGVKLETACQPGTYTIIERSWRPGDQLLLRFDYPIRLIEYPRSEFGIREAGYAIQRGPLIYALPVQEDWQEFQAPAHGPGTDIRSFRVLPMPESAWNYALILDRQRPETGVKLIQLESPEDGRPWEYAPVGLQVAARRVLNWYLEGDMEHPKTPLLPFRPMKLSEEETLITLVPFGFTHLRMTFLPVDEFSPQRLSKITAIRQEAPEVLIQVDGGMNTETLRALI